jgi:NADPH:quinone reductase-like Zn-dependent oxidoreductase
VAAGAVLLVLNGSGGVGHFVLQLARIAGARSIATAGARNQEFVMSQGAEAAIDTSCSDLAGAVAARFRDGVDIVLDAIGGEPLAAAIAVVKPGGVIVSVVDTLDPEAAKARGVRFERISSTPSGEQLAIFAAHAGRKKLLPHVQTIFPLASAALAQEESRGGHVRGKLVLAL